MGDRRRINGPGSGTSTALFVDKRSAIETPQRKRKPNELRKIFLQTGLVPSANGSAYLELENDSRIRSFLPQTSTLKLSCTVHGPKPLPRNASFSPNLQLTASVKFAPFATRQRRGYIRDNVERDLGSHLENALKGAIIPDRWPKSAIDVAVTVLEGEEDCLWIEESGREDGIGGVGLMNVLAGSITVSAAALVDANIETLDMVVGGVSAKASGSSFEILDPCPSEHGELSSACVVGYLPSQDEIVEIWSKTSAADGNMTSIESLIDSAKRAAKGAHKILTTVMLEDLHSLSVRSMKNNNTTTDIEMKT